LGARVSTERTLVADFPDLIKELERGSNVLDVGCGPGSITLDVAKRIAPGSITGIDINPAEVKASRDLAKTRKVNNARFDVMDAHRINYPENTFDLIYSYTVAQHLWDPVLVIRGLKRVAKPGAVIITAGIRDFGFSPIFPTYPAMQKVWNALIIGMRDRLNAFRSGDIDSRGYWDFEAARKCVQWYS
jgi:ubiquinone/menaquinone biosynthesis C-methylase UbiE